VWTPRIKKPETECDNRCSGHIHQFCGGKGRISIYRNFNYDDGNIEWMILITWVFDRIYQLTYPRPVNVIIHLIRHMLKNRRI
jgi:hypothetical protein